MRGDAYNGNALLFAASSSRQNQLFLNAAV
jgi:hypothetical protein